MLVDEQFERVMAKDVIARIFEIDDRDAALKLIDEYEWLWLKIVGTRGMVGKKSINASAQFNTLFG
jgi:hypothetical protein